MKFKIIYTSFLLLLVACLTMSNKAGRAKNQQLGSTGAPGDNDIVSGVVRTCAGCHAGSATIQVTLQIEVLDGTTAVTKYTPGKAYTARVTVVKAAGSPAAYGFQMIALKDVDNTDLKGFSAPGTNVQISTTNSNGRKYAEHKAPSAANVFEMTWTAPASGTGPVTFYASGNGVNNNNASGGDAAAKTTLTLTENSSATENFGDQKPAFQLSQNPVLDRFFINFDENRANGAVDVDIFEMAGRQVFSKKGASTSGGQSLEIDASDWQKGIFLVRLSSSGQLLGTQKLVKI